MDVIAAGFWGAFFGTALLLFVVSAAAYVRLRRRVALILGCCALVSSFYVVAHLGGLGLQGPGGERALAHIAILVAVTLAQMLLSLLGLLRQRRAARRSAATLGGLALAVIAAGWLLSPRAALVLSWTTTVVLDLLLLAVSLRSALAGNRVARLATAGMAILLVALLGLSWIALDRAVAWPVHAVAALAAMAFLSMMGAAAWSRYSYLLELREVLAHGPSYDPVTRMRSHSETGNLVGEVFFHRNAEARPVGVISVVIANLYALENLHGRAAFNHALYVCAGRLRRCVPQTVEMGRLGEDGFLLLTRNMNDIRSLVALARQVRDRLARPVALSVSRDLAHLDAAATSWVAEAGIGLLVTNTQARPSQAVSTARAMSQTAWSYPSRLAMFDEQAGHIVEVRADQDEPSIAGFAGASTYT